MALFFNGCFTFANLNTLSQVLLLDPLVGSPQPLQIFSFKQNDFDDLRNKQTIIPLNVVFVLFKINILNDKIAKKEFAI